MQCGSYAGFIKSIQDHRVSSLLAVHDKYPSLSLSQDVSCSFPHLQKGFLVAALCVSAGVTWCGWLCFLPTRVSWGSYNQSGMQGDMSGRGRRRIGCWDGSSKTKLWTPLIGEKSTYPEPDSSCSCAHAKRWSGKTLLSACFSLNYRAQLPDWEMWKALKSGGINPTTALEIKVIWYMALDTRTWYMSPLCGPSYVWRRLHV